MRMSNIYDRHLRSDAEQAEQGEGDSPDGLTFNLADLPAATAPSFDPSIFDDMPLDEDGVPVLPDDFDRRQLPGYEQ
jgi:hypothetical protein